MFSMLCLLNVSCDKLLEGSIANEVRADVPWLLFRLLSSGNLAL